VPALATEARLSIAQAPASQRTDADKPDGSIAITRGMGKAAVRTVWGEPEEIRKIRTCFEWQEEWVYRGDSKGGPTGSGISRANLSYAPFPDTSAQLNDARIDTLPHLPQCSSGRKHLIPSVQIRDVLGSCPSDCPHLPHLCEAFSIRFAYISVDSGRGMWYKRHKEHALCLRRYRLDDHGCDIPEWWRWPLRPTVGICACPR
jgi:hypothetical protein